MHLEFVPDSLRTSVLLGSISDNLPTTQEISTLSTKGRKGLVSLKGNTENNWTNNIETGFIDFF